LNGKQVNLTKIARTMHAAFASANPKVPMAPQEMLIAISRFTFLLEVQAKLDPLYHNAMNGIVDFQDILETSPASRTLDGWVDDLAADQAMIASYEIAKAKTIFVQADGAPDGSQPKGCTWWDVGNKSKTPDGSVRQFFA
jgi:hypothetical protein